MKYLIFIVVIFIISCNVCVGQTDIKKLEVTYGTYIESIHNLNFVEGKYEIVFWIWINSKDGIFNPEDEIDIAQSVSTQYSNVYIDSSTAGVYHIECKVNATILNLFNVSNFPFDRQKLILNVEFANYSTNDLNINLDNKQSKIIPEYLYGWETKSKFYKKSINYGSNFGSLTSKDPISYPTISLEMNLSRNAWNLYFKSFLTLLLSFILAIISLLYPNENSEEKIGLIVGSLFTTVGNKYVTDDILPIQNSLNLSDKLHLLTILVITLIAAFAIIEQRMKLPDRNKTDFSMFLIFSFLFFGGCIYFTLQAMN
jgi:hypothetical protein